MFIRIEKKEVYSREIERGETIPGNDSGKKTKLR